MRPEDLLRRFVHRADDRRLERTVVSRPGLRLLLAAMCRRFDPAAADGFAGEIGYELTARSGRRSDWTIDVGARRATARRGRPSEPRLVVRLTRADLARLAAGDLDPGAALLSGRLDLEGDLAVATRLGEMFGRGQAGSG